MAGYQNVSDVDDDDVDEWTVTSLLTRSDAGLYTCVVKNIAGHVTHNISLFIEGQTPSRTLPYSAYLVTMSARVSASAVQASSQLPPHISLDI